MEEAKPSIKGKEFYPDTDGMWWDYDFDEWVPCTCKPECSSCCTGSCGCDAHRREYSSVMSARND